MTVQLDLAALRKVAEAATPGPWRVDDEGYSGGSWVAYLTDGLETGPIVMAGPGVGSHHFTRHDAEHIATFDPPTVIALLDEIKRLQALQEEHEHVKAERDAAVKRAEEAEDALRKATTELDSYKRDFPCDGGCNYNSGPEEECSAHGRPPRELWGLIGQLSQERDRYKVAIREALIGLRMSSEPDWPGWNVLEGTERILARALDAEKGDGREG